MPGASTCSAGMGVAPGMHAREIGLGRELARGDIDGEGLALKDGVVGPAAFADGNGDARGLGSADAPPRGGHDVGTARMVVCAHEKQRSRKNKRLCAQ